MKLSAVRSAPPILHVFWILNSFIRQVFASGSPYIELHARCGTRRHRSNQEDLKMKKLLAVGLILVSTLGLGAANVQALSEEASNGGVPSLAPMLENVTPAVVIVSTSQRAASPEGSRYFNEEELRRFFNDQNGQVPPDLPGGNGRGGEVRGTGSGVIVDAGKGYIVTNHHVIAGADEITVSLQDGREYQARLIGSDASTDVALLQIEADELQALSFANIDNLRVGDYVVAIGNPFGIGQTVTSGIVSALGRGGLNNENYEDFIQTDAAINVGNSGGALVDLEGRLIGINTAIISGSGSSAGIAFAVPVDMIAAVMEHLERDGEVRRGQLGVQIQDLTSAMESTLNTGAGKGALVTSVIPGSAAEAAGIQVADVITEIAGRKVESGRELRNIVGGEERSVAAAETDAEEGRELNQPSFNGARLGTLEPSSALARAAGASGGVEVLEVDEQSPAFRAGLRPGDIIQTVNRSPVTTLGEFDAMVSEDAPLTVLGVLREGRQLLVILS
jgi:Do/DeqQ family serine protease